MYPSQILRRVVFDGYKYAWTQRICAVPLLGNSADYVLYVLYVFKC